jgi:hypothetical protein
MINILIRMNPFIYIQSFEIFYTRARTHTHTLSLSLSVSTFLSEYVPLFSYVHHFRVNLYLMPEDFDNWTLHSHRFF